jgi:K+-transporting ATPase ATPase A chain
VTLAAWCQLALYVALVLLVTKPLGAYMLRVFEGERRPVPRILGPLERFLFRLSGVDPREQQTWVRYAGSMLIFSLFGVLMTYGILRLQKFLPLNPQKFDGLEQGLAFNTSVSFATNTNWQAYSGESSMSYLSQMAALAWHNFVSAAAGIAIAIALARGLTRRLAPGSPHTLGNFWADLIRCTIYVLLPMSLVFALVLCSQGVIQNLSGYREITSVEGVKQIVALGPVASQEAIKELGTNGGGFFNANSAHPFENPSPFTNFVEMWLIFAIPAGLTYTYGRMARDARQGWAILAAMGLMFLGGTLVAHWAEAKPNQALASLALDHSGGNMEGKEVRFGTSTSALFATITTDASCGAVNSMHDSFNPLGGLIPLVNIELGEVIFGGVGAGLYGILVFVVLSVFIAGLMVGRTPEYLGKKIEGREMKLAMLYVLIFPLMILGLTAWASITQWGTSSLNNAGPHGLTEILYAFSSGAGNNGSAFAGLNANTPWYNTTLGLAMLGGRFLMIIPALAIAGAMVGKKVVPPGPGTFPTNGPLFTFLLVSVVLIVGALTFFPALSLGPIVEHFAGLAGKVY